MLYLVAARIRVAIHRRAAGTVMRVIVRQGSKGGPIRIIHRRHLVSLVIEKVRCLTFGIGLPEQFARRPVPKQGGQAHLRALRHHIRTQTVHRIIDLRLSGIVGTKDPGEIEPIVIVEVGGVAKWLAQLGLAIARIVGAVGSVCRVRVRPSSTQCSARIGHPVLIADRVVVKPGALPGDGAGRFAKVLIVGTRGDDSRTIRVSVN